MKQIIKKAIAAVICGSLLLSLAACDFRSKAEKDLERARQESERLKREYEEIQRETAEFERMWKQYTDLRDKLK